MLGFGFWGVGEGGEVWYMGRWVYCYWVCVGWLGEVRVMWGGRVEIEMESCGVGWRVVE